MASDLHLDEKAETIQTNFCDFWAYPTHEGIFLMTSKSFGFLLQLSCCCCYVSLRESLSKISQSNGKQKKYSRTQVFIGIDLNSVFWLGLILKKTV